MEATVPFLSVMWMIGLVQGRIPSQHTKLFDVQSSGMEKPPKFHPLGNECWGIWGFVVNRNWHGMGWEGRVGG